MNLYTLYDSNTRRTWLYLAGFLIFIIGLGWIISYFMQSPIILYVAIILSIILNFFAYWYSDKIILAISKAKPIQKQDNPELYRLVENLCIAAGLPLPKIYIIQESQPNAFATGRDPKHGVITVTTGLLQQLDRTELEGVIAHELAHIGNRDILLSTIAVVMVGTIVIVTDIFFRMAFWGGTGNNRGGGQARLIMIAVALALAIFAPLLAQIMKMAISRKREFLADASGALLTRYPEGLAKALEKISKNPTPLSLRAANDATAHLFIVCPFKGKENRKWLHKLFSTHPPVEERIKALRGMKT
jgi:heat shock protein HtpX